MKLRISNMLITLVTIFAFTNTGICNDPDPETPWPIGFNTGEMNISRTLMNSYGDLNGSWLYSVFHGGIDIDGTTGYPNCNEVRCVDDGYATIVDWNDIPGTEDEIEWVVIICDGLGGTVQNGWSYGHLTEPGFPVNTPVAAGQLIGYMHDSVSTPHVHFMWTDWDENEWSYCNPLKYLSPSPTFEDNFIWSFNPDNNNPSFDHFFLEDMSYSAWENLTVVETQNLMLDQSCLSGNVDFFFGVSLRGEGMPFGQGVGRNDLTSQKIKYDVVRELATGTEILDTRHVFDFDCELNATPGFDSRAQMLYFRHSMDSLQFGNDALAYCLTNCTSSGDWDGINTICEEFWNTDCFEIDATNSTVNPVLAKYPDGAYHLDVLCYSFDEDYNFPETVEGVELHNFCPALKEVLVIDSSTDGTYYRAIWEPDASGLLAELNIVSDQPIPAGTELEVILLFTEEMNTGTGSVSASLGTSSISNGNWTSSTVSNDTWTGEVTLPSEVTDQTYVLSVSASDTDNNDLMDPEGAGTVPGSPTPDTHHAVTTGFPAISHQWTTIINSPILSSPKLADIDLDGDLDVIIQSTDGYVDVLDGSGTSLSGWPVSGGWSAGDPEVWASPAIVNLSGASSTAPEILAVHPHGCNGLTSDGTPVEIWNGIYANNYKWHLLSSPVAGDFNNDNSNEYVLGRQYVQGIPGLDNVFARTNNGSAYWDTMILGTNSSVSATPSLGDLTGDGYPEVLVVADMMSFDHETDMNAALFCLNGITGEELWHNTVGGLLVWGAVTTGNLDSDPQLEIVVGALAGSNVVKVIDGLTGANQQAMAVSGGVYGGTSIADVNADGILNVVVSSAGSGGMLYCWDVNTGDNIEGFPVSLGTYTESGVSIGDIDGDGYMEMVIAGQDGMLHAINHDGTEVGGFPVSVSPTALSGQAALGDIDGDGRLEIIFGEEENSILHCYEMGENSAYTSLPWPQFQHDAMNTGCYTEPPPAPPTNLQESSSILGDKILVDLTWQLSSDDPGCVTEYRIYRQIFPYSGLEHIGTVSAGVTTFFDAFRIYPYYSVARYHLTAWDGEHESEESNGVRILLRAGNCISTFCPVSEVLSSHSGIIREETRRSEQVDYSTCSVLTDYKFDRAYIPSGQAECIEIDLGALNRIEHVSVIRSSADPRNSEENESFELCSYSLSTDGNSFTRRKTGSARYVRIYGAAGATEIEIYGTSDAESSSALIDVVRNDSGAFTAQSATGEELTLQVFDLMGRTIWEGTSFDQVSWPSVNSSGSRVPAGVYLLRVESQSMETLTTKVVVR